MRGQQEGAKPPCSAQTGWSDRDDAGFRRSDHPVRSNKGSFAPSLLMSRPPLIGINVKMFHWYRTVAGPVVTVGKPSAVFARLIQATVGKSSAAFCFFP